MTDNTAATDTHPIGYEIPSHWERHGLVIARAPGESGCNVAGDPCIVWDDEIANWRMVMFYSPPGHGQAVCIGKDPAIDITAGNWRFVGPLPFTNPQLLVEGTTHKPYIVQDAYRPNHAAKVNGKYWLLSVGYTPGYKRKYVHRAFADHLAGPWTWEEGMLIPPGGPGEWDEKHTDAVTGIYFADRDLFVYYYMGYPRIAQPRPISPFGSAQGVAIQKPSDKHVTKLGMILPPCQEPGHWASGWIGGLQILPGRRHRWIGLANASPTAPNPNDPDYSREEPPPSLGGFAWCDQPLPISNWHWCDQPIESIDEIPPAAHAAGEGVNLWRHHLLQLPAGRCALYYNTGRYGTEQLYMKSAGERRQGRQKKCRHLMSGR